MTTRSEILLSTNRKVVMLQNKLPEVLPRIGGGRDTIDGAFPPLTAELLLIGYTDAFVCIALAVFRRRDIGSGQQSLAMESRSRGIHGERLSKGAPRMVWTVPRRAGLSYADSRRFSSTLRQEVWFSRHVPIVPVARDRGRDTLVR